MKFYLYIVLRYTFVWVQTHGICAQIDLGEGMVRRYAHLFSFRIFAGTMEQLLEKTAEIASEGAYAHITFVTAIRLLKAFLFEKHATPLRSAKLLIPQGRGMAWLARRFKQAPICPFAPSDVFMNILRDTIKHKQTLFFLGSKPNTIIAAVSNLRKSFPELRILGAHHGYYMHKRSADITVAIRKAAPNFLFVGMGYPKQEQWVFENKKHVGACAVICVGNTLDLCAGKAKRGPVWMRQKHIEGFGKALVNPLRFFRAFWLIVLVFVVYWHKIFRKNTIP